MKSPALPFAVLLFAFGSSGAQVKISCIGNSITDGATVGMDRALRIPSPTFSTVP